MAVPDVSPYVDLRLSDVDSTTIVTRTLAIAASVFPDWQPREGNTEVVLIEALASMTDTWTATVNRLPGAVFEVLMGVAGLTRDQGAPATATATVTLGDTLGHTVPAGTALGVPQADGSLATVHTATDLLIGAGASTGSVTVVADAVGATLNGSAAGTSLTVLSSIPYVTSVVLSAPLLGGRASEDGTAFRNRGAARLSQLTSTLVKPAHFTAAALAIPGVGRAYTLDNTNGSLAFHTPGADLGYVTVVLADSAGNPVSTAVKTAVTSAINPQKLAALSVSLVDPTQTTVPVTLTVHRTSAYTDAQVQASVTAALQAYLNPASWQWLPFAYLNELVATARSAPGVDRVVSVAAPTADAALTGYGPLAVAGAISVTVTSG